MFASNLLRIFELAPGAQDMFSFGTRFEMGSDAMYASKKFHAHARSVFGMVDAAVHLVQIGETSGLADALVGLGGQHYGYGVRAAHYPIVGKALIHTLQAALGEDFTKKVLAGWKQVYAVIFSGMEEGAFYQEFSDDSEPAYDDTEPAYIDAS
jgi:hemoglobin-like flavoprotein